LLGLIGAGSLALSVGCSGVPGADGGSGAASGQESVGTTSAALETCSCSAASVTTFTASGSLVLGPPVSTHVCFATEFQGRTNTLRAFLIVDHPFSNWTLNGFGKMSCVPQCCFRDPGPNAVRMVSPTFATDDSVGCSLKHTNMWWGDAGGWVNGISKSDGSTDGFTLVDEFAGPFSPRQLHADNSCGPGRVAGFGQSYFVGVAESGDQANLSSGFYSWVQNPATMISASSGICYFTAVGAFLTATGRKATISLNSSGRWVLSTTGSSQIQAAAQCMFYQQ
jgi:hypothetical protein